MRKKNRKESDPFISIRLPADMTEKLDECAKQNDLNRSQLIRKLIRQYLNRPDSEKNDVN